MSRLLTRCALAALLATAPAFTAWAGGEGEEGAATTMAAMESGAFGEAPALAQMVAAGDLPPVEERLPDNPMVVT